MAAPPRRRTNVTIHGLVFATETLSRSVEIGNELRSRCLFRRLSPRTAFRVPRENEHQRGKMFPAEDPAFIPTLPCSPFASGTPILRGLRCYL